MAALPKSVQDAVQAEAQSLLTQQASTQAQLAQASTVVTTPAGPQQQTTTQAAANEITVRLNEPQGDGIRVGRVRDVQEDIVNQTVYQNIASDKLTQITIAATAVQQPAAPSTVSRQQAVEVLEKQIVVSKQRQQQSIQALQKLQRTCNHKYDKSSRRCLYCSKHRDSHVYDTENMILEDFS